jgi:metal-sulfur cluster biosynthetic enzyme
MVRIDGKDADAIGEEAAASPEEAAAGKSTEELAWDQLRTCYDPEIPVNIVDLGLVYDVKVADTGVCNITMTLTSQACPEARTIPDVVKRRVNSIQGVKGTEVQIVWDPPWTPQRISAEGRSILGIESEEMP